MTQFRLFIALCLLFIMSGAAFSQETESVPVPLQWSAVEGAGGYRVEIQDAAGNIVFTQDVKDTVLDTSLPAGTYQLRVTTLNRFGKAENATAWKKLTLRKILPPVIQKIDPQTVEEDEPFSLAVAGTGFDEATRWEIFADATANPALESKASAGGFQLRFAGLPQGNYKVRATGRTGKTGESVSSLTVVPHSPLVTGVVPDRVEPHHPAEVRIEGKYLRAGSTLSILTDQGVSIPVVATEASSSVSLSASLPALDPGSYKIIVLSPSGKKASSPLTVLLPPPVLRGAVHWGHGAEQGLTLVAVPTSNLTPDTKLFVVVENNREEIPIEEQLSDRLIFALPRELKPGAYDLVAVNNQETEGTLKEALRISSRGEISSTDENFMFIYPTIFGPLITLGDKTYGTGFGVDRAVAAELRNSEANAVLLDSYASKLVWGNTLLYSGLGSMISAPAAAVGFPYPGLFILGLPLIPIGTWINGSAYEDLSRSVAARNDSFAGKVTFDLRQFGYKLGWKHEAFDPHDPRILDVLSTGSGTTLIAKYRTESAVASLMGWSGVAAPVAALVLAYQGGLPGLGLGIILASAGLISGVASSFVGASAEADLVEAVRLYNNDH